jgi:hypothetical protein
MENNVESIPLKQLVENGPNVGRIRQIGNDQLHTARSLPMTFAEVIQDDDFLAFAEELSHGVRTDVACSAGDEK